MKKVIVLVSLAWMGMAFGTTVHHETVSCGSCAKKTDVAELGSSNEMGSKDLDLRPAPMMRETVSLWLQECPSCGYVAKKLEEKPQFDAAYLKSKEYKTYAAKKFKNRYASKFYRMSALSLKLKNLEDAYWYFLCTAWLCDDAKDVKNAKFCRELMDELFPRLPDDFRKDPACIVRHIDVLRRSSRFEKALKMCSEFKSKEKLLKQIVSFEKKKCLSKDTGCYTIWDATQK